MSSSRVIVLVLEDGFGAGGVVDRFPVAAVGTAVGAVTLAERTAVSSCFFWVHASLVAIFQILSRVAKMAVVVAQHSYTELTVLGQ